MPADPTAAELVAEAKRLDRDGRYVELERLIVANGPHLVALVEAAVEFRAAYEVHEDERFNGPVRMATTDRLETAERAFDALARGEKP